MCAEVAQSTLMFPCVNLVSEYFRKGDVAEKPLLGPGSAAVSDAGHLAVLLHGFVQALVAVHMLQGQFQGIILPKLVAFQVVAFEHCDWAIEFGDIQAQVIRPNFFVGSVRENLITSHTMTVQDSNFFILFPSHVIKTLICFHIA